MLKALINLSRLEKNLILILFDFFLCTVSFFLAFFLRLDSFFIDNFYYQFLFLSICLITFFCLSFILKVYEPISRFFFSTNFYTIIKIFFLVFFIISSFSFIFRIPGIPRTISILFPVIFFLLFLISRLFLHYFTLNFKNNLIKNLPKAVLYGNVETTSSIYHLFSNYEIVGFLTDEKNFQDKTIDKINVYTLNNFFKLENKSQINTIFAIDGPNLRNVKNKIKSILSHDNLNFRVLPRENNILDSLIKIDIDNFKLNDRKIDYDKIALSHEYFQKKVLITGGGGSIGSEIALQVATFSPSKIIILENSEINLYNIVQDLTVKLEQKKNFTLVIPILLSIQDLNGVENIIKEYKPDYIFNCAAYKHVNLVENNIIEAVKNNFFSTYNLCKLCLKYKIKNFILISSDKAVNPANIMGCTKRLAELAVQYFSKLAKSNTKFVSVRFANVLNSSGSVIPLFVKQIKKGGPITVTHKKVSRYFMSIKDAVILVFQSTIIAKNGEILLLKMGNPVKIYDLAVKLINFYGLKLKNKKNPNGDIKIIFTGLKPGEKIKEELTYNKKISPTSNKDIVSVDGNSIDLKVFEDIYRNLETMVRNNDSLLIKKYFSKKNLFI